MAPVSRTTAACLQTQGSPTLRARSEQISYSLRDKINTMTTLQDFMELDTVLARDVDSIAVVGGGSWALRWPAPVVAGSHAALKCLTSSQRTVSPSLPAAISVRMSLENVRARCKHVRDKLVTGLERKGQKENDSSIQRQKEAPSICA